jgi:hypothetical protein
MQTNPVRRALVALVTTLIVAATFATTVAPAAAQTDTAPPAIETNSTIVAILTSPDVVSRMILVTTAEVRDALADGIHAARRLVQPREWGESSPDVALLQTMIDVDLVDGLYGPATAATHRTALVELGQDPVGIVPGESVPSGPTATAAAPAATPLVEAGPAAAQLETAAAPEPPAPATGPSAEQWAALRFCESSGNYSVVNPTGTFRGAYQFSQQTWNWIAADHAPHLVGVDPAAAAPADQDFMAYTLYSVGGPGHWPVCGRYLY